MIKLVIAIVCVCCLAYCGATVKLGKRSFFGHVQAIWKSDETKDLLDKAKDTAKPYADKLEKGAKAGWKAVTDSNDGGVAAVDGSP